MCVTPQMGALQATDDAFHELECAAELGDIFRLSSGSQPFREVFGAIHHLLTAMGWPEPERCMAGLH